jgi:pimeloyl-ACP methyl ester carboxylesterase
MKLDLDGRTVSYRRSGKGAPILWIHAFPFSRLMWEAQMAAFAPTHTVVALDLPGVGGSTALPEEETSVAAYARACEAVANKVNPNDPWIVAGLSLGGYVAFELVRRHHLRMSGLVLADTRAVLDTPAQLAGRHATLATAREQGAAPVAESLLGKMVTDACPEEVRAQVLAWMRATPKDGMLGTIHALITRPDSVPTLAKIEVPSLLLVGEHDPISPPAEMEAFGNQLKRATVVRLAGAAHLSNIEQPEAFNDAIRGWLASSGLGPALDS